MKSSKSICRQKVKFYLRNELMYISELLKKLHTKTGLTEKEVADYISSKERELRKWKRGTAVPSKYQLQNLLHLATLYGVDVSSFDWEQYIESVLRIVYEDEYRIDEGIDENQFKVHLSRIDGSEGYVPIEEITNKKKELFRLKN